MGKDVENSVASNGDVKTCYPKTKHNYQMYHLNKMIFVKQLTQVYIPFMHPTKLVYMNTYSHNIIVRIFCY